MSISNLFILHKPGSVCIQVGDAYRNCLIPMGMSLSDWNERVTALRSPDFSSRIKLPFRTCEESEVLGYYLHGDIMSRCKSLILRSSVTSKALPGVMFTGTDLRDGWMAV